MLYECNEVLREISFADRNPDRITVGVLTPDELKDHSGQFGFDAECIEQCAKPDSRFRTTVETFPTYMFAILSARSIGNVYGERDRMALFIQKNLFFLVIIKDKNGSLSQAFTEAVTRVNPATTSLERIICLFFDRLVRQDNAHLETYEKTVEKMEAQVEEGTTGKRFNADVLALRRKLLIIRNYYAQFVDLTDALEANEDDLFRDDKLHHFANLGRKMDRLASNTQLLRDNLMQVREAYQSSLDYTTNQIMKVFTVITTVFLPLTLIVGWYGMNFTYMPELGWRFGYIGVIVLSVIVVVACFGLFKKKKLL